MSRLRKRSILLAGHPTSVALEPEFWAVLERMAAARGGGVARLVSDIDRTRAEDGALASALRLAALGWALAEGDARRLSEPAPVLDWRESEDPPTP